MIVLYLLLALASAAVGRFSPGGSSLRQQVNAWWLLFPVVSLSLLFYRWGVLVLIGLIAVLAARELAHHQAGPQRHLRSVCGLLGLVTVWPWWAGASAAAGIWPTVLLLALGLLFAWRRSPASLLLLLFMLLCLGLDCLWRLLQLPLSAEQQLAWCFYLFVVTALNDIAQFVSGKTWGRHQVAARISPNKTWQGLLGGVAVSVLLSLVLGGFLDLAPPAKLAWLGLLLSLGGFAGDLLFSSAKRLLGIKDFSSLIPGHGGILDRVDSLVLTAPLLYLGLAF